MAVKSLFTPLLAGLVGYWAVYHQTSYNAYSLRALHNTNNPVSIPTPYFADGDAKTSCSVVKKNGVEGCEDVAFWTPEGEEQKVLTVCDPGRRKWNPITGPLDDPTPRGSIWVYDYQTSNGALTPVKLSGYPASALFHPLGLGLAPATSTTPATIFIANQNINGSTIEVFELSSTLTSYVATHTRTIDHVKLHSANDFAVVSNKEFYVSNDHRFTVRDGEAAMKIEVAIQAPIAWVSRVVLEGEGDEGVKVTTAATRIAVANGVALSKDGTRFAVASSAAMLIKIYERSPITGTLTFVESIPVPFAPDNLHFDPSGALIVAGHPEPYRESYVPTLPAPSWIISVSPSSSSLNATDSKAVLSAYERVPKAEGWDLTTLFQTGGDIYSTASSALKDGKHLISGSTWDVGLLHCKSE